MQKRFQTLQNSTFQKLNFLTYFFSLFCFPFTQKNTFFTKGKWESLYWMENFNFRFRYLQFQTSQRSWPSHSQHQNKSTLNKVSNVLVALFTSSHACHHSNHWTLKHGLLKRLVELGRECFCVPHLTTLWDTMSPTRHERHISHLEGDCRSGRLMLSGCWKGKAAADPKPSTLPQASAACSQQGPHVNGGTLVNQTTLVGGQRVPAGSFSQNLKFAAHVTTIITKTCSCSH